MTMGSSCTTVNQLYLFLAACSKAWFSLYLIAFLVLDVFSPMIHVTIIGLLLCLSSYFKLPPADAINTFKILGSDPRNLDGTPSRTRGTLGLIAHRGAGLDAPENSLEAVRLAKKKGAKCIEFDVLLTSDDHAVVFHDENCVGRVTEGSGMICHMTLVEVKRLDLAAKHVLKDEFSPTRIPTMEEFIDECLSLDLRMLIDLKTLNSVDTMAELIVNTFKRKPKLYEMALASSFFPDLLYAIRRKDPKICCSMAWRPGFITYKNYSVVGKECVRRFSSPLQHHLALLGDVVCTWAFHEFLWYFLGLSAVLVHKDTLTPATVQRWRERGVRIIAWTVNNSLERVYLERVLHVTTMSDTMDEIGLEEMLKASST